MTDVLSDTPTIENISLPEYEKLRVADRSDASSAQAIVRVLKGTKILDFDKHHFERHEPALIAQGWQVIEDLRHTLK